MPVESGFSRYACDVQGCQEAAFALPDTGGASGFSQRRRLRADGSERSLTLCSAHAKAWDATAKAVDEAFSALERTGEGTLATQADLEAERARTQAAQASLAEAEKARKWWGDKYRALEAEYAAYKAAHPDGAATGGGDGR